MHNAPSVTYPVGRSIFLGWLLAGLWLCGMGACVVSWLGAAPVVWRLGSACSVLLLATLLARRFWLSLPQGVLRWDGHAWLGPQSATMPTYLSVHLDLQRHLLVRLHGADGPDQWLWLEAATDSARWDDLRRAVYSRAMPESRRHVASP